MDRRMIRGTAALVAVLLGLAVSACQGNLGSGPGLPQGPQPGVTPGGPGAGYQQQSRSQTLEGAVFLTKERQALPFPEVGGFSIEISLIASTPSPAGSTAPGRSALAGRASATAAPTASPSPSPTPTPGLIKAGRSAPKSSPTPAGPKIDTKTTIYPDDAPAAPTPQPTGDVETFVQRHAVVRGYFMPHEALSIPSLAAIAFTIPSEEQTNGRGWTVALYATAKRHKLHLLAADPNAQLSDDVVTAHDDHEAIKLAKNTGYVVLLFGDALAPTPAPYQSYPAAGAMPGQTPYPSPGFPGAPAVPTFPGATYPPGAPTPYPQPTFGQPTFPPR